MRLEEKRRNIEEGWNVIRKSFLTSTEQGISDKNSKTATKSDWFDEECERIIKQKSEGKMEWIKGGKLTDHETYKEIIKRSSQLIRDKKIK